MKRIIINGLVGLMLIGSQVEVSAKYTDARFENLILRMRISNQKNEIWWQTYLKKKNGGQEVEKSSQEKPLQESTCDASCDIQSDVDTTEKVSLPVDTKKVPVTKETAAVAPQEEASQSQSAYRDRFANVGNFVKVWSAFKRNKTQEVQGPKTELPSTQLNAKEVVQKEQQALVQEVEKVLGDVDSVKIDEASRAQRVWNSLKTNAASTLSSAKSFIGKKEVQCVAGACAGFALTPKDRTRLAGAVIGSFGSSLLHNAYAKRIAKTN